jgi:hypothetical protein
MRLQSLKSKKNFIFSQKVNEIKTILCSSNYQRIIGLEK